MVLCLDFEDGVPVCSPYVANRTKIEFNPDTLWPGRIVMLFTPRCLDLQVILDLLCRKLPRSAEPLCTFDSDVRFINSDRFRHVSNLVNYISVWI